MARVFAPTAQTDVMSFGMPTVSTAQKHLSWLDFSVFLILKSYNIHPSRLQTCGDFVLGFKNDASLFE